MYLLQFYLWSFKLQKQCVWGVTDSQTLQKCVKKKKKVEFPLTSILILLCLHKCLQSDVDTSPTYLHPCTFKLTQSVCYFFFKWNHTTHLLCSLLFLFKTHRNVPPGQTHRSNSLKYTHTHSTQACTYTEPLQCYILMILLLMFAFGLGL